ncbi:hypothetical protein BH23BAC1_BH23BAC1_19580 [soil metagenome]
MKNIFVTLLFLLRPALGAFAQNEHDLQAKLQRVLIPNGKITIEGLLVSLDSTLNQPAVIFLGGSGFWEIVEEYLKDPDKSYGSLLRFYIEENFCQKVFQSYILINKEWETHRAIGKKNDFYDRASDALAAFDFLKKYPGIDSTRIGMAGHSQGGWIAQIAAARNNEVSFVLSFAGPTVGVIDQTKINDENSLMICEGMTGRKLKRKLRLR